MMITLSSLTEFLGWCTLINFALMAISTVFLVTMRKFVVGKHQKIFHLDETDLDRAYFHYLATYKLIIICFNLVPYLALKIMA